jgi:hypothetical protein
MGEPPDLTFRSERGEPTERNDRTRAFSQPPLPTY